MYNRYTCTKKQKTKSEHTLSCQKIKIKKIKSFSIFPLSFPFHRFPSPSPSNLVSKEFIENPEKPPGFEDALLSPSPRTSLKISSRVKDLRSHLGSHKMFEKTADYLFSESEEQLDHNENQTVL